MLSTILTVLTLNFLEAYEGTARTQGKYWTI